MNFDIDAPLAPAMYERLKGWVIRWWEFEMAPDGKKRKVLRYERLGEMSRKHAAGMLGQRLVASGTQKSIRSRVEFRTLVGEWEVSVLPVYRPSTQKHRRFMLKKHLLSEFGDKAVCDITRQDIQAYVARLMQADMRRSRSITFTTC